MPQILLESAVRAALIAAATATVLFALRVRSAGARHAAWLGVVLWMLALPAWILLVPKAAIRILPAPPPATLRPMPVTVDPLPDAPALSIAEPLPPRAVWNWWTALLLAYGLVAGLLLCRLAIGILRARSLMRAARPREGHWTSDFCAAPVTVGWLHPRVILPDSWRQWSPAQLAAVLAHEQEHVRRRDPLVQLFALVNRAVFWFHPLAWWLERRLSALAEEACDAAALSRGHDPHDYSRYLLDIARAIEKNGMRIHALGMAMPGSALPQRIRQILSARPAPPVSRARAIVAAAACLLLSAAFAAGALAHEKRRVIVIPPLAAAVRETPAPAPVSAPAPRPPVPDPPPPPQAEQSQGNRLLVLYFELPVMDSGDQARAVSAAQKFIDKQLTPTDRVAIMTCCATRVLQDFTGDHDVLLRALEQVPDGHAASLDPERSLEGLRNAIDVLSHLKDRKALVYFSKSLARGTQDIQPMIQAAISGNIAIYPIDVSGLQQVPPRQDLPAPAQEFDAASVKPAASQGAGARGPRGIWSPDPGRVTGRSATFAEIVRYAYNLRPYQLTGPSWLEAERYDLDAKATGAATAEQLRQMMRSLLAQRFQLSAHSQQKEMTVYEMTVAAGGPKMPSAAQGDLQPPARRDYTSVHVGSVEAFARSLSNSHPDEPPIIDKTGLTGSYQFVLALAPGDDLASALQAQLGLKLTPKKLATEILVVDHAEKTPAGN